MHVLATRFIGLNDIFWGQIPQMPGAYTWGETEEDFESNVRDCAYSWLEEIETGRASHTDLYPHDKFSVKEYYEAENDAMTAISSLAAAVEDVYCSETSKVFERDSVLVSAAHDIIKISEEDVAAKDAERVFIQL